MEWRNYELRNGMEYVNFYKCDVKLRQIGSCVY